MSFVERRKAFRPKSGEAPFADNETFFSRTDERGIIRSGNFIFQRLADYGWDHLLGAPHKIVRHPDMPQGVFWLLWQSLQNGRPFGAYIKNLARDGLSYWAYAVTLPFGDGFLSVNLKPGSEMLPRIKEGYRSLRAAEAEEGLSPQDSGQALLGWLKAAGFESYSDFQNRTLVNELAARDLLLECPADAVLTQFRKMIPAAQSLQRETHALVRGFEAISTIPTNMRIIAARLEPSGGAISALSQNYWTMSEEMSSWFRTFVSGSSSNFSTLKDTLEESQFLSCTARILSETATQFGRERRALGGLDMVREKKNMDDVARQYLDRAAARLRQVVHEAEQISSAITVMRRYALGLSSTRVMCNIESARLPTGGESLVGIIRQLDQFQTAIEKQLGRIDDQSQVIQCHAATLATHRRDFHQAKITVKNTYGGYT